MIEGKLSDPSLFFAQTDINQILKLAKQAHENYLIRSNKQDLESAIDYYLEAIQRDPSLSEAYYRLASLLWERGEIDINSALEQCEKAIKLAPESATARLYLGYFLKAAGRFDDAQTEFKSAISLNKFQSAKPRIALGTTIIQKMRITSPSLYDFMRGMYYFFTGIGMLLWDFNSMRMLYRTVVEDVSLMVYKTKGSVCKKLKNYDEAIKIYENAAEKTGKTELFYKEIADISLESGNYFRAIEYYKSALRSSPDNTLLWAKLAYTLQMYCKDNINDIKDCFNNLARLEPNNSRIYYELGHLYIKLSDKFSAVNAFKKAVELEPNNPFYHNSLAYALVQLEDYEGAVAEYQKAIKLNPDNDWTSIVSQALGAIYHQVMGNIDAAIMAYQTAVVLDNKNVDAYIALGEAYQDKDDLTNAIDSYCEAIKLDPTMPRVYCNLGLVLWEKEYIEESMIAYQKAIALNPKYEIAYNNLGVVCLDGANKPLESLSSFDNAIKCNPNYALAYYNKGRAYQMIGNNAEAAKYYQMAADINKFTQELDEEEIENKIYSLFSVD